jgi:LmbE family N-acetylglucosaminyl deacetylase
MVQAPALMQLQDELGQDGVQVIPIDAIRQSEAADAWGVLSVPTTFVLDRSGQARQVNHGVARAEQLKRQIEMLA